MGEHVRRLLLPLIAAASVGCTSMPERPGSQSPGGRAADSGASLARAAAQLIGVPYRYGGDSPLGFDCSGLVYYTHHRAGLIVPRTAAAQSRAAQPVDLDELQPGDLIFFRIGADEVDHVGIYVGRGRFIHAPRRGRVVSLAHVRDPYYFERLSGAGRFW